MLPNPTKCSLVSPPSELTEEHLLYSRSEYYQRVFPLYRGRCCPSFRQAVVNRLTTVFLYHTNGPQATLPF